MKLQLNDGEAFVEGRSPQKARELLKAAEEAGLETDVVRTTSSGYIVPKELAGDGKTEEGNRTEVGTGLPREARRDGIDDPEVEKDVAKRLVAEVQPTEDAGVVEASALNQSEPTDAKREGDAKGTEGASITGDAKIPVQETGGANEEAGEHPASAPEQPAGDQQEAGRQTSDGAYDPSDHSVEEVNDYLANADEAEQERVLAAERDGKARKTILKEEEK